MNRDPTYCLMFLQTNHSTAGVGSPLVIHTTDWPVAEPWWMSIRSTMTAGTVIVQTGGSIARCVCMSEKKTLSRDPESKSNQGLRTSFSLTFDLQDQSDAVALVSIFHSQGVVPAVLLLRSDQGKSTHVAAQRDKTRKCNNCRVTEVHNGAQV